MRVLVVEDSRALADVVAEGLRDQGMAVDVAYDGLEAATKLDVNSYEVLVLDRDLPGLHGDTICRMIAEGDKPVMVLMLTASGAAPERVTGSASGPTTTWPNPSTSPNSSLGSAPSPAASPAPSPGPCGPRVSSSTLCATPQQRERPLDLSVKEFGVLEALMRAQPGFLSAEDLLEQVWDEHADPFTKTVSVTISLALLQTRPPRHHRDHPHHRISDHRLTGSVLRCQRPRLTGRAGRGASLLRTSCLTRTTQLSAPLGPLAGIGLIREEHGRSAAGTSQVSQRSAELALHLLSRQPANPVCHARAAP